MGIDHDRLFKGLLQEFLYEFLELFFPTMAAFMDRKSIKFRDQEVLSGLGAGGRYQVDLVAEARMAGSPSLLLLHVEVQTQRQQAFPRRMFRYFSHLYDRYDLPIYPVALYSHTRPGGPEAREHVVDFPDGDVMRFRFRSVQLNRLRWRDYMNRPNPVAAALMTRMAVAPRDRPRMKAHCLKLLGGLRLDERQRWVLGTFVETYAPLGPEGNAAMKREILSMSQEEARKTMDFKITWDSEHYTKGLAEGLEEGRVAGRAEGQVAQARAALLRILTRRFGKVPARLRKGLLGLDDLSRLETMLDLAIDAKSLEDFVNEAEALSQGSPR